MAGIGFELRKILREDSWLGVLKAYLYAGALGSGAWVLSVLGVLLVGATGLTGNAGLQTWLSEFQVSVTWIMSGSLVTSAVFQLVFTRFVADCLYQDKQTSVVPNLLGAIGLVTLLSFVLGSLSMAVLAAWDRYLYNLLFLFSYIVLCNIWILVVFVAGLRRYRFLLAGFFLAYTLIVMLAWLWQEQGVESKLLAFFLGHGALLLWLFWAILKEYPVSDQFLVSFEFLEPSQAQYSLCFSGLFLYLGIWIDKWMFWFFPETSVVVNAFLRASPIYDPEIFIAYLAMIPGMAAFLLRIETDFVDACQGYYRILTTSTLSRIEEAREEMLQTLSSALLEVLRIQGLTMILVWLFANDIAQWLGWPEEYAWFLRVDVMATSLLVLFISLLNVAFYFNFLRLALWMTAGLCLLNALLTLLTLLLGKSWYGVGFALSLLLVVVLAWWALSVKTKRLEYETFMLQ
ncbi:MAG: exopolysaccharide Pel transporter PelG [Thiolinea sp.]